MLRFSASCASICLGCGAAPLRSSLLLPTNHILGCFFLVQNMALSEDRVKYTPDFDGPSSFSHEKVQF